MNVTRIISKVVKVLPKLEGTQARFTIGSKQLAQITKENKEAGKVFKALTKGAKDPKIDVAYKAQSNYAIAAIRVKDGGKVYANGAVSLTNPGQANSAVKYRLSLNEGKTLSANGFLDTAQPVNLNDIAASVSRRNGIVTNSMRMGETSGCNIALNENDLLKMAKSLKIDTSKYTNFLAKGDNLLNHNLENIRQVLSGKWKDPMEEFAKTFSEGKLAATKVKAKKIDTDSFKKIYSKEKFDIDKINKKINPEDIAKFEKKIKEVKKS